MDILFHTHTQYSKDCMISLDDYKKRCQSLKVVPCITDHNTIDGALAYRKRYGKNSCIIGEEIMTKEGEIIGLYMKQNIEPGLPVEETIRRLREQGALIAVPHMFDRMRHSRLNISKQRFSKLDIDFIEIFNSRTLHGSDNKAALNLSKSGDYLAIVGADSHFLFEMENSVNAVIDFDMTKPKEFLKAFRTYPVFNTSRSGLVPHAATKIVRFMKRHSSKL